MSARDDSVVKDWGKYAPFFTKAEFDCKHTGKNEMKVYFMDALYELRKEYGKPMIVNSGFRDATHPIEAKKLLAGTHSKGIAVDISADFYSGRVIIALACKYGFTIGVSQKSTAARFIHLDLRDGPPGLYSY